MVAIDAVRPNSTITVAVDSNLLTNPRTLPVKSRQKTLYPDKLRRQAGQTGLDVDPAEQGDEEERNQAGPLEVNQERVTKKQDRIENSEGGRLRSEQARDLVQRVNQLLPLLGDMSLATHIGLLKRDLSRCHDALKDYPGESNYLSLVTLVESAMAQLKWKQYTRQQVEAIRQALDIGYRQVRVRFEDYDKFRTLFAQKNVDATPRIDLESLKWEDIADEEE